jgi:hypothetical protein
MLNSMMNKAHLFCRKNQDMIREEQAEYLITGLITDDPMTDN